MNKLGFEAIRVGVMASDLRHLYLADEQPRLAARMEEIAAQLLTLQRERDTAQAEAKAYREGLEKALVVLDEVARLDKAQKDQSAKMSALAKRARAGEKISHEEHEQARGVVDFGDVWERLLAVRPKLAKVLKAKHKALAPAEAQ